MNHSVFGSVRDISYDDKTKASYYHWDQLMPVPVVPSANSRRVVSSVRKLADLCIDTIVENIVGIDVLYLDFVSDVICERIWKNILKARKDSYQLFSTFASRLGCKSVSFKCHWVKELHDTGHPNRHLLEEIHRFMMRDLSRTSTNYHRFVNVFSNVRMPHFVLTINQFPCRHVAYLDLSSRPKLTRDDVKILLSITNLAALDVSNNKWADTNFVLDICQMIRRGKLSKLKVIRLVGCPADSSSIRELLSIADKDESMSSLVHIEVSEKLSTSAICLGKCSSYVNDSNRINTVLLDSHHVSESRWILLNNLGTEPEKLKYYSLARIFDLVKNHIEVNDNDKCQRCFHLDIAIHNVEFDNLLENQQLEASFVEFTK